MSKIIAMMRGAGVPAGLVLASLLAAAVPTMAGNSPPPLPPQADTPPDPVCASYGKDFTRIAGTATCIRISGNVQVDGYRQSSSTGDPLAPALKSR